MSFNEIKWTVKSFSELTVPELYEILHLRCKVFVVEQDAPYLDLDYKDQLALHLCGYVDDKLVAYSRLFKSGDYFKQASIGRVVVATEYRRFGYGHALMDEAIRLQKDILNEHKITISAQLYLKFFYESHGFIKTSEEYLEDGIPHIQMQQ